MKESSEGFPREYEEGFFSAISAGVFFVLVGAVFVTTPNLFERITAFFGDFDIVHVPNMEFLLLAPESPGTHSTVYSAVGRFSFVWGLFQIVILALRFVARSPLSKKAETVSNIVFWLGTGFLIHSFLNETTTVTTWFAFWAATIMLIGVSLINRAIIQTVRM